MTISPKYTTQLQAGLGLVPETIKLLDLWEPGMSGQDLLKSALASGEFPTVAARRLRNVVIEAFGPRYLTDGAGPARLLKLLLDALPRDDLRALCFLFTCRANAILGDFVRQVYWPRYSGGGTAVSREESTSFVSRAVSEARTTTRWSQATVIRVARYLLGACADFGLVGPMAGDARPIVTFRLPPNVAAILAHELHFKGLSDNAILRSPDWELFGLEAEDVLAELKRLALRGALIVQSAGTVTQVAWRYRSMDELANDLAQR
jgi:hypothetical protein